MRGLLLVFICLPSLLVSQYVSSSMNLQPRDNRVTVELYYQALCPYCKNFISGQLKEVLTVNRIWEVANFRLIPYGNADMKKQGTKYQFTCLHGQSECQGNILMNCALNLVDVPSKAIPFIICLQSSNLNWDVDGQNCASTHGLDFSQLKQCTNSLYGRHWQYQAGLQTQVINVDHVPYIVINGVYNANRQRQAAQNLMQVICQNYNGNISIPVCLELSGISTIAPQVNNQNLINSLLGLVQPYPINYNSYY